MPAEYGYLNAAVTDMLTKITSIGGTIDHSLQPVYFITGALLFLFACIKFLWQRDLAPWAAFVVRYIQLMAIIFVSGQWMPLTDNYVSGMGAFGANAAGFDILQLAPSAVILRAMDIASRMYTENVSWMRVVFGSTEDTVAHLLLLIGCLGTILLAVLMAAWIMLFFVVFKLATVIALVFLAFMMFESTRFMAAPGLARILAYGVQMLVLGLATGLFFMTLDALDLSGHLQVDQSLALLVVMFFFALLFKYTTDLAREQVSGMPSLGLHDVGHTMGRGAMMGAAMLPGAAGVAGAMLRSAGGMPSLPSFRGPAMGWRGSSGGGSAGAGSSMPSTGGMGGGAPASVSRMLNKPPIDATWTEARDLPKTAARLLEAQRSLLAPPRQLPPPRS